MISVEEARTRILRALRAPAPEVVPLAEGWGRVLTAPARARLTQPPHDVSAMDGYALRADDGALGAELRLVGAAPAGHPWSGVVGPGETVRIFTGSVIPAGADGVLIQEDATPSGDGRITVGEAVTAGRHIRRAGQDFAEDDVLVEPGHRLGARDIGLLAAGNHAWITVNRRPRIAILATGDEIALPGEPIPAGGIVSSNSHALAALVRACGGEPIVLPVAKDDPAEIAAAGESARGSDMLVTTGGASVGEHDLVASSLSPRLTLDFWKIAMRPGKPLMFGALGDIPMLGLPGNPVSALICAILFLIPAIHRLAGLPGDPPPVTEGILGAPVPANDLRADHLRATLKPGPEGIPVVTAFSRQDSAMLRLLTRSDAVIMRPPHAPALPAGEAVPIIRLDTVGL